MSFLSNSFLPGKHFAFYYLQLLVLGHLIGYVVSHFSLQAINAPSKMALRNQSRNKGRQWLIRVEMQVFTFYIRS